MKIRIYVLTTWLLWSQAILATHAQEQRWLNVPDTPLKFSLLANKRSFALTNVSSKVVQRHTLGCVDRHSGRVTRKLRVDTISLAPGVSSLGELYSYQGDLDACEALHSALSVIAVTFADGRTWKYKPPSGS